MAHFGEILKELRSTCRPERITQEELAKALSISHNTISAYERGTRIPTLDNLMAFADFFGVSIDYLAGRTKYNFPTAYHLDSFVDGCSYEDLLHDLSQLTPNQRQAVMTVVKDMKFVATVSRNR